MSVTTAAPAVVSAAKAKDWSYLAEKAPTELHVDLAAYIEENSDLVDVDPKIIQAVLAMHATWQKTDRIERRRRTEASIAKGGATTAVKRGYELVNGVEVPINVPAAEAPVETPAAAPKKPATRRRAAASKPKAPAAAK